MLDSGGFTELNLHGGWTIAPATYAAEAQRYADEIGNLAWAAPMDWMCEPAVLAKTGLSVPEHQSRTLRHYRQLCELAPEFPWVPVLQGWHSDDYLRHCQLYEAAGLNLEAEPIVALGSVCRRQNSGAAEEIVRRLQPLRLHAFGFKLGGLDRTSHLLASADSMAWSTHARRRPPMAGCPHRSCANCRRYAEAWYQRVLERIARSQANRQLCFDFQ